MSPDTAARLTLFLLAAGVGAGATGAAWYVMQPGNYDECMLAEMRGQAQTMYSTVQRACARRHGREVPVELPDGFNWHMRADGKVSVTPTRLSAEFAVTRASFRFSSKECQASLWNEWTTFMTRTPQSYEVFVFDPGITQPRCIQWQDVHGRYRQTNAK